jgi:DNA polymerase-3 subunit gamma/tau
VSYLVLARKYRPQTFEDLVGQDHVARTLANAIATGRIAHAFLFTGLRGVGKTTSARLLAKCLNCVGPDGKQAGPTATPCNACSPCKEITAGQDLDVQEIDGASYNGVDEVRRLQEAMGFRPARDRFKVYIVDEVHMLSAAAWNAFLKTLEEPPPHVKFIFATTEVHKVPVTILSRCQRYDFKLIATQTIARRLEQVLANEGITASGAAVQVLAREAAGSMRDAMSLLDQVLAFSGATLSGEDVTRVLGVADRAVLHELSAGLVAGDAGLCIAVLARLAEQGFDLAHVARDLLRHLRNLVVAKVAPEPGASPSLPELLDLADEEVRDVVALAARAEVDDLSRLFQGLSRAFDDIVRSGQPRMALEMVLVRLARRPPLLPLDELLARVGELERRLAGPTPTAPVPRGGGGGTRGIHASPVAVAPSGAPDAPVTRTRGALALVELPASHPADLRAAESSPRPVASVPASAPNAERSPNPEPSPRTEPSLDVWRTILERLRSARPAIASIFEHAVPIEVAPERVVLGFEPTAGFLATRASDPDALEQLTTAVRGHFGVASQVQLETELRAAAQAQRGIRTVAAIDAELRTAEIEKARAAIEAHPLVQEAMRVFGAQLRDVKLPGGDG